MSDENSALLNTEEAMPSSDDGQSQTMNTSLEQTGTITEADTNVTPLKQEVRKVASIHSLLKGLVKHKASDLHVKVGRPPLYRINGKLMPAKMPALNHEEVKILAYNTMTQKQIKEFEEHLQIDFGYLVPGLARFRANVFMQKGTLAFVIRVVPLEVPTLESLGLPHVIKELALKPRGLLLVTGATGSGKSTTLAAIIEYINRNSRAHVVTIEDPIEYIFEDKKGTISQREIGVDAVSLPLALRGALRQDPDVIMVGEMRDFATIQTAITAAETGHLVVSTLHTNTAAQSIDRIIDSFPVEGKQQLRLQLASSLVGVVSQRLVKKANGNDRVVACEILTKSPTVEKLIIDNKLVELEETMEASNLYYKMQSMNQALEKLVRSGEITQEEAILHSDKKEDLVLKLSGMVGSSHADPNMPSMDMDNPQIDTGDDLLGAVPESSVVGSEEVNAVSGSGIQIEQAEAVKKKKVLESPLGSFFKKKT
ncbi:MAG: type IV pilus twitching motility protein PilT [Oligoflexia bacterium]|nr:type IV pilus twitching motility protein PilT [Oligoflexia bacterium]